MDWKKLVGIGQRKPDPKPEPKKTVREKLSTSGLGSGFLELFRSSLQSEKTASDQLIKSFYGWVYANVSAIAEEVSKINPELYKISLSKGDIQYDEIKEHPLLDLLDKFNSINTASEAFYLIAANLELAGDAFLLKDNVGIPNELYLLDPTCITVNPKDDGFGVKSYEYKRTIDGKTKISIYQPELIIHIKTPNPENPLRGKSTVAAAATAVDTANLAQEFLKKFFQNGAIVNFALTSDQRITPDEIRRVQQQLKRDYGGVRNAFKALILGGGFKVAPVQNTNKEMEIIQLLDAMRDYIMAMFKNTKSSLGIVEDVNRANAEASLASWKASVIRPKIMRIVDSLNEYLTPLYGDNLILGFEDPVPENRMEKVDEVVKLMANSVKSVITVNEAREVLEMSPIPDPQYDKLPEPPAPVQPGQNPNQPNAQEGKRLPRALKHINVQRHLRRIGVYGRYTTYKSLYSEAKGIARRLVEQRAQKPSITKTYTSFSDEQALSYWQKQVSQAETVEAQFKLRLEQYLKSIEDKAVAMLAHNATKAGKLRKATTKADLVNEEGEVQAALDLFTPLMDDIAELSGVAAYELLNISRIYTSTPAMHETVKTFVQKMANSVVGTDRDKLEGILQYGLEHGQSVAELERRIRSEFGEFRKNQSQRIARTEVLRASNAGSLDAYRQSGVVSKAEWLTAPDCKDECLEYNGKVIALGRSFFNDDYSDGTQPPLHPNCRCTLLPVVDDKEKLVDRLEGMNRQLNEVVDQAA